ncbi:PA5502 family lipoprotein [Ectopseudomonas mendocina]|uniref:PA5502 family lipoprotein n=1 Tax=Ectopseudomonas mendocina TaxID=300 RepID=UPI0005A9F8A7|nr:PA5502 family lipoprotein [Pseudomonas mendocina]VEE18062.1 putative lipoprotein [Pseudomonas mendocina]
MKSFAFRGLPLLLVLLLVGCQSSQQQSLPPVDDLVIAFRELDLSLAEERLDDARSQLSALQQRASRDTRLEQYQRQLAEAYMEQGQEALQQGDLDRAAQALGQARSLMPQAPALSHDLNQAIDSARAARQTAAEQQAREAAAKLDAERQEQLRQQRLASERQAKVAASAAPANLAKPVVESTPSARLIDPSAATSVVALPMLDSQDNQQLRRLLDSVAADVVTFRCAVRIEVREAKDYPWVAALLSARIKKLDPSFRPQLSQTIAPQQVPRLLLSPQRH